MQLLTLWLKARERNYWNRMTDEEAQKTAYALAYECGMAEAGYFMDEYRRRKAQRISNPELLTQPQP